MPELLLDEKEFKKLKELSKWNYVKSLYKRIEELQIQADKNCEECEKQLINVYDLNIDYLFEDWRACSEHCDECGEEEKRVMCDLQFQVMNLIANSLAEMRERQNALAKIVLRKYDSGAKMLKDIEEKAKEEEDKSKSLYQ
ncbi:MAG: hypothetical protein GF317_12890 [Candidatus Lokiarchaeota archaeon]|nr:hypothetical protein [Candidatus Lokiarchaeota archaeon]MBD3200537.1 hypothetical protein [Candidatus Lokiarchaeota archaeon]